MKACRFKIVLTFERNRLIGLEWGKFLVFKSDEGNTVRSTCPQLFLYNYYDVQIIYQCYSADSCQLREREQKFGNKKKK